MNESLVDSIITSRIQCIADVLLMNASFIDNIGLLNGKMGIAIFFYHFARYSGSKIFDDYAGELIDEIYEEIKTVTPVDFANGLTGIGWGIEYLVKNGFIEADTDDALEDLDNIIHKSYLNRPILLDNGNDLFGYGFYYIARLQGHEKNNEDLTTLIKKRHLIFLTDECERLLIYKRYLDFNILTLRISTLNSLLWFLIEMHQLELFPTKIHKLLRSIPEYLEFSPKGNDDSVDRYVLWNLAQNVLRSVSDTKLQAQYQCIANKIKNESIKIEDDNFSLVRLSELSLQRLLYPSCFNVDVLVSDPSNNVSRSIDNKDGWSRMLVKVSKDNLGLTGLAGIGLCLVQTLNEDFRLVENNKDMYQANSNIKDIE